jgi:hypothetical protein
VLHRLPIPVAAHFNVCENGPSLAGIVGFKPVGGAGSPCLMSVVCCQADFFAIGRSLVQKSPTECGVSECDQGSQWKRNNLTQNI